MGLISFDVETTIPKGTDPKNALDPWAKGTRIFAYAACDDSGSYIVNRFDVGGDYGHDKLHKILSDKSNTLIAHNFKFEVSMLLAGEFPVPSVDRWHDTMIVCKLLNNLEPTVSLDGLAIKYGPKDRVKEWRAAWDAVHEARQIYGTYDMIPRKIMDVYQRADVEATMMLFLAFYPELQKREKSFREYREVEMPVAWETAHIEKHGVMLHRKKSEELLREQNAGVEKVTEDVNRLLGRYVNLNSAQQLQQLLYRDMKIEIPFFTEKNVPATDKDALEQIETKHGANNPKLRKLLDCTHKLRATSKGSAIIKGYLDLVDEHDIIHPHLNTILANTLRQSCTNPNLQNVANEFNQRTRYAVPARRCFRARPKHILVLGDYSGIEMRLGVQGTGSKRLIEMVRNGFDFHDACAASFYGERYTKCADKKEEKAMRSRAKNARFAMFYGCGIATLAQTLGISVAEAKAGMDRDKREFPEFYVFMDRCTREAEQKGFVETFYGHRLYVPRDRPYASTDYCIQGTAAAIMKRAEINVQQYMRQWCPEVKLLLVVHDELVFEYPWASMKCIKEWREAITECMINVGKEITVPLGVEWEMSVTTWDEASEVK